MSSWRLAIRWPGIAAFLLVICAAESGCQREGTADRGATAEFVKPPAADTTRGTSATREPRATREARATPRAERAFMDRSARAAWAYVSREATPRGLVGATKNYPYLTVWDMASTLAAAYAARELGFINSARYKAFVGRTLTSLENIDLYDGAAYNRMYSANTGAMVDNQAQVSTRGGGWSALDHGRLLVWLKIVAGRDADLAPRAQRIVSRLDMARIVKDGYMQGEEISARTGASRAYNEGRLGYEQYAAEGFALWGAPVGKALDFSTNGRPFTMSGQTLLRDGRGGDVLTSEPFVMMGLELGWKNDAWRQLALAVLAVQEARFRETGIVTMVSEDAIPVAPAYFYYYVLFHGDKPFAVTTVSGTESDSFPRWVSAKAAFGYHALAPSAYTWRALQTVQWAGSKDGWTAGVYEGTRNSTKTFNLNTAAIVLESAAYMRRGCALVQPACPSPAKR